LPASFAAAFRQRVVDAEARAVDAARTQAELAAVRQYEERLRTITDNVPVLIGYMLRKKFRVEAVPEGAAPAPRTGAQKLGRLAGNLLFWGGILGILFMVVVVLNFKGKI